MKVKDLLDVLQGAYNANPEVEIFFSVDHAEALAKVSFMEEDFTDSFGVMDVNHIKTWVEGGKVVEALLVLESTNYPNPEASEDIEEFDKKYSIK
jgi:hypothetical protein